MSECNHLELWPVRTEIVQGADLVLRKERICVCAYCHKEIRVLGREYPDVGRHSSAEAPS